MGVGLLLIVATFTWGTGPGWAQPDYTKPNFAFSPILNKFVNQLPGLGPTRANNLGQYIPIAVPDTGAFPGSDYYVIGLKDYTQKMHNNLSATKLRGYYQKNVATPVQQYLGPLILATKNRPVRLKFDNELGAMGAGGDLFIPHDNTVMGAGMGPLGAAAGDFPQNRATLHLHGGVTPWISDGTAHQWITPAGEPSQYQRGIDNVNVPDMPDPGPGSTTFYWPNDQSGRLMFFHDHAYGITRLNVYVGEAAGYLLVDPAEEDALKAAGVPGTIPSTGAPDLNHLIPLIIQDKSYVSNTTATTDPLWDFANWGGIGSLWFPHVYVPNQLASGVMNDMGRWDYGPWVYPPIPVTNPNLPHPSIVPEAFMDTPVINGTAYPFINVQRRAYRFRILNASNDRFWNLQLYVADDTILPGAPGYLKEVKMVPADGTLYPNMNPQPGEPATLAVPADSREGGVPDPTMAGPPWIQIASEGGVLPEVAVIPNTCIDFDRDTRSFTFGNVRNFPLPPDYPRLGYSLYLGPAERADVIVDFSDPRFAGKRLILYNDAPAPVAFFDPRYDFYTGNPDQTARGGAPSTLPGKGPNTRTIMQIRVGTGTPVPFDLAALQTALPTIYSASQEPAIVADGVYGDNSLWGVDPGPFAGIPVKLKSIVEDFDGVYGRMNALLGTERTSINPAGQETFGFDFIEPPTEVINENGTQIWFVIHNGIDTHAIHFHLLSVQVVNRVDWAGIVKPPDPNERGWKETVRFGPYDNAVLAVRPKKPTSTFPVPTSVRPLDVTKKPTGLLGTKYNKNTNKNPLWNFDWQYVWHCHILGHEENDMMRPFILVTKPFKPANVVATKPPGQVGVNVRWRDNSKNEAGFTVQRATNAAFTQNLTSFLIEAHNGTFVNPGGVGGNVTFTDNTVVAGTTYYYRALSRNGAGNLGWVQAANPITP
jgi:FtsP/CotA-like multicopper oxidase with cupredoxin domain